MPDKHPMTLADVEVIEKTRPHDGYFHIDRYQLRHRQYSGEMGPEISREIFERGHAAACILYDPDLDRLVLLEQFRTGAFAATLSPWYTQEMSPWLIEVVAGIIEEGEDPEAVVRREAVEEAGCEIEEIEVVAHYLVSPGGSSESMFLFCGRVDASAAGGVHGLAEEGEDIRVFTLSPDAAFEALEDGRICNSTAIIAIQWFRQHHARVRGLWRRS